METKVNEERWDIAQNSEKGYWKQFDTKSLLEYLEKVYSEKAEKLLERWRRFIKITPDTRILQIGCGPLDIINYIPIERKYSIDPLADLFKKRFKIDYNSTNLQKGVGEQLPFQDKYFDIVIITNALDHTQVPSKVLSEMNRVLKDKGILHLEVQVYRKSFLILSKILGFFKELLTKKMFNIHHPYMFLLKDVKRLLSKEFSVIVEESEDIQKLKEKRKKQKFTQRFPVHLGLLGNIEYIFICKKK